MKTLDWPVAAILNHLLARQPSECAQLGAHAGKRVAIDAAPVRLHLAIGPDGLFFNGGDTPATVTITVAPADLPRVLTERERATAYVHIAGDAELARTLSEVLGALRWEIEDDLAPFVGELAAVRIARAARATVKGARSASRLAAEQLSEYLLEENPMLLYRRAGEAFAAEVTQLRDDVERLSKRIALLERSSGSRP